MFGLDLGVMAIELRDPVDTDAPLNAAQRATLLDDFVRASRSGLRPTDVVARTGEQDFVVICPEAAAGELVDLRRDLEDEFASDPAMIWEVSMGVSELEVDDEEQDMLDRAHDSLLARRHAKHKLAAEAAARRG